MSTILRPHNTNAKMRNPMARMRKKRLNARMYPIVSSVNVVAKTSTMTEKLKSIEITNRLLDESFRVFQLR